MLKVSWLVVLLLCVNLLLAACGSEEAQSAAPAAAPTNVPAAQAAAPTVAAPQGDAENGKQLFLASCSACHGPEGMGVKGLGKDMTRSEFIAGLSDEELVAFLIEGRPVGDPLNTTGITMPPKGGNPSLTDEQLLDIVAFIRSIHQ